jgi:enoyl-CoA hydratase / 3-hydroxyacyl-CoA dehydrogenase
MSFVFQDREIRLVGIVGSGQIGPDIALHFSKVLSPHGVSVVIVDISEEALSKGHARLDRKVDRGMKTGAFSEAQGATMKAAVTFTTDYERLATADLVIEAASEDLGLKQRIFEQLEGLVGSDALLASNSSHLEPEVIASRLERPQRSLVIHYFFPAERNPIVEVVPGPETDAAVVSWLLAFYEAIGKVPIQVASRYGYALDPIFEGVFQAAALCVEDGLGSSVEVDFVATSALGLTVGPFTAMNLTGGNPLTHHGLDQYTSKLHAWYRSPALLRDAVASGQPWEVPARGQQVEVDATRAAAITRRLQGSYLGLCDEILSAGLVSLSDFEMAAELALDMTPPVTLARRLGFDAALALINEVADSQAGFPRPRFFASAAAAGEQRVPLVLRRDVGSVAVLTIRRPKTLNAMNQEVFDQLGAQLEAIADDAAVSAAVITGYGVKSFVSGADVGFLSAIETPRQGIDTSRRSQAVVNKVDRLGKPVVAAMNGLAFGGGLELAMACRARLCVEGLRVFAGQPEPNLGIIPGAGGTQRLPRLIGLEPAAKMLRDGKPISSARAVELGLVTRELPRDRLLGEAIALAASLASGEVTLPGIHRAPLSAVPDELPELDIGHLSKAIDGIIVRAILGGARLELDAGLELEATLFGDVCQTKDMDIGLTSFLTKGPRARASFVHS